MTDETRRRAPYWVRQYSHRSLHALAGKLLRDSQYDPGFSPRQDWLLDMTINELEYRRRRDQRDGIHPCTCQLCLGPFDDGSPV